MKRDIYSGGGCDEGVRSSRSGDGEEGKRVSCGTEEEEDGSRRNDGSQRTGNGARWGGDDG